MKVSLLASASSLIGSVICSNPESSTQSVQNKNIAGSSTEKVVNLNIFSKDADLNVNDTNAKLEDVDVEMTSDEIIENLIVIAEDILKKSQPTTEKNTKYLKEVKKNIDKILSTKSPKNIIKLVEVSKTIEELLISNDIKKFNNLKDTLLTLECMSVQKIPVYRYEERK